MTEIVKAPFSYDALTPAAQVVIQQNTREIRDLMGRAAQNIVEIGERLILVKEKLGHGQFLKWLEFEFAWEERTARNMMNVARSFKSANFADLQIGASALYLLSEPSTPAKVVEESVAKARSGKPVTHREVRAAVTAAKSSESKNTRQANDEPATPPTSPVPASMPESPKGRMQANETPAKNKPSGNGQHITGDASQEPWAEFNASMDELIGELRAWGKRLAKLIELKSEGRQVLGKWAKFYSYTATTGAVNAILMDLEQSKPAAIDKAPPGYVSAGTLKHRQEIEKSTKARAAG